MRSLLCNLPVNEFALTAMASTPVSSSASQPNLLRHYTPTVTDCSSSGSSIPVVDLSEQKTRVVQDLVKACEDYGFFKVVNHGISQALIDAMEAEAEKLFALPLSEKERAGPADPYGYGNRSIGRNGDVGWIEYLLFRSDFQYVQQRYKAISPDNYINFCNTASKYISATKKLACDILELLAEGLGLPENVFSSFLTAEGSDSAFRLNHYPPCPDPSNIIGFGEHTDPQILTVLHSNDVGGLQVLCRDGKWVTVSPDPSSFSINIGDCMQVLTNGRFKSVRHRAVTNTLRSRISMMFFGAPALDATIVTPSQLVDEDRPAQYMPFLWSQYKKSIYGLKLGQTRGLLQKFQASMVGVGVA